MSVEVFGFCNANCRHRVLTLDQTANLIQEMAANGFQVPEGFIPKTAVNSIIEQNSGKAISLFVGTQAEYDAWTGDKNSVFAIISDDPTLKNLLNKLDEQETSIDAVNKRVDDVNTKFSSDTSVSFGDYIVSKKKLLWSGNKLTYTENIVLENLDLKLNDIIEIEWSHGNNDTGRRITRHRISVESQYFAVLSSCRNARINSTLVHWNTDGLIFKKTETYNIKTGATTDTMTNIYNVWKIIE